MAKVSFFNTLTLSIFLLVALLFLFFTYILATTINIQNNCPYIVWAASVPGGGWLLDVGQTWVINPPPNQTGARIWARTNCTFDGAGRGQCQTGDYNGLLECEGYGAPPNTLVEYALNQFNNLDWFEISLVEGFNVPVEISPASDGCSSGVKCNVDVNECPIELQVPGGWNHPCKVFNTSQYCCTNGNCGPTYLRNFFKDRCPNAYSYATDNQNTTFTCPRGTNYKVVFCPDNEVLFFPASIPSIVNAPLLLVCS